ncbi:MAG TPA: fatty acid--CoA ligase [Gammaproteobacteria bacterium]|nr:fatty acid--CoA ligase [Gammaproteobacteria bacterium]
MATHDYPLLIKQLWHTPLACAPDQEIVYRDSLRYNYHDLWRRIGRLANSLHRSGVRPGDTVAVMDWDSHRYLECYFAVPMMGAVLMTVNTRLTPAQILYTLNHARADILLVHADFVPLVEEICKQLITVKKLVLIGDGLPPPPAGDLSFDGEYEEWIARGDVEYEFPDFDEHTRATTFYTTATTGDPKGVYYTHRQLVLHTLAAAAGLASAPAGQRFHRGDVYMPLTPMFHVHAWGVPYMATMFGVKQVYPGRYAPDLLLRLIREEQVTFSHCVPTLLRMVLTAAKAQQASLKGWKVVIGGSALPPALAQMALDLGVDIFAGYGLSETAPVLTLAQLRPEHDGADAQARLAMLCRAGAPIPLVDLRIADENMNALPHDGHSAGEIVVRAPWLTAGYLHDEAASERLWRGGYLHTQDIGVMDDRGYLRIRDRLKDVIKVAGEWVSSLELEHAIAHLPGVAEVAVIGVPDPRWGERPLALIVRTAPEATDEAAIAAKLHASCDAGTISKHAVLARIQFVDGIAKTGVGKIDKKALRSRYS